MDEEDFSRYFTDEAEQSNYNAPASSDYSRYFTDEAEQSNYNAPAPYDYSRFFNDESGINQNTQFPDRVNGPTPAILGDTGRRDQDNADYIAMLRGNQTVPGVDQPAKLSPFDAQTEFDPNSEQAKKYLLDKTNLLRGIQSALPGAKKQVDAGQMSKKDMLSLLMPMLLAMIAKQQGGGSSMSDAQKATQPNIPNLTAKREMTPYAPTSRPGAGGKKYFSDVEYRAAGGGIGDLGGYSDGGRLLKGPGDGVSDSIPAKIGESRPARLSDGEFVIPARIVSELGNGSTEAGAKKLYAMMDRVKKARNHKNIAANTKADKHLPA
jgi:hypothetical protein